MRFRHRLFAVLAALLLPFASASASSSFSDDRFLGGFSTDDLDEIIQAYELFDGWYWTTPAGVVQTYHGMPECPGWTDTSVNLAGRKDYRKDWYGCRWGIDSVLVVSPGTGGWGECFGFAQFIGYLISGERNPQKNWDFFYSLESAGGFRVGDIVRVEYRADGKQYRHSAVVYAVNGEEILFMQISGSHYNRISIGLGFTDGNYSNETNPEVIAQIPSLKICRSPLNR